MPLLSFHVTLLGITAIAIHDEGNVLGHWTCLENKDKQNRPESKQPSWFSCIAESLVPLFLAALPICRSAARICQLQIWSWKE